MAEPFAVVTPGGLAPSISSERVRVASATDLAAWQQFVDNNKEAGCMHHAGWYRVLRDAFWVTPYYLIAINEAGVPEGILPLYFSCSPLTGRHISSLEDGVLADTGQAASALLNAARALRDETGSRYLQIRGGAVDRPGEIIQPTVRTFIDTTEPVEKLWAATKKKTRWAVRQAEKQNLAIEHDASLGGLDAFYAVYAAHMRDLGTPVFGPDMFRAIVANLGHDRLRLYLISDGGRLIGGMLCIVNGRRWADYYAIVRPSSDAEFANYLLYWHVIRDASQSGAERLDLGRSTPDSNVHLFKRKWRGFDTEVPYHFYVRPGVRASNVGFTRQKQDKSMLQRCWSTLPLAISNRLGPLIRKQLPFI
jgi:serine/alanine adding enzyme